MSEEDPEQKKAEADRRRQSLSVMWISIGSGMGVALGTAFGVVFGNIGLGVAIGVAVGTGIVVTFMAIMNGAGRK